MDAAQLTVDVRVRVAWWLRPYLEIAAALERLGVALDFELTARAVDRAITVSINGARPLRLWSGTPS